MTRLLQSYLKRAGMSNKSTMHSFRAGGAVAQALAGEDIAAIMRRGFWKTEAIARRYLGAGGLPRHATTAEVAYKWADEFPLSAECRKWAAFPQKR